MEKSNNRVDNLGGNILRYASRGTILDLFVFVVNLLLMQYLLTLFIGLLNEAAAGEPIAQFAMFLFCISLFILPPLGATLKRWHFHRRLGKRKVADGAEMLGGCLFNPIFYFCLTAVIFAAINAFVLQFFFKNGDPGGAIFVSSILFGIVLMLTHTYLVYRYFSPPKRPPSSAFLRGQGSEFLGDVCIFTNMLFFQLIWNLASFAGLPPPSDIGDAVGRILVLGFLALLLYFPPRMFYLAENINNRRAWLTILLANSPLVFRMVFGTPGEAQW